MDCKQCEVGSRTIEKDGAVFHVIIEPNVLFLCRSKNDLTARPIVKAPAVSSEG